MSRNHIFTFVSAYKNKTCYHSILYYKLSSQAIHNTIVIIKLFIKDTRPVRWKLIIAYIKLLTNVRFKLS